MGILGFKPLIHHNAACSIQCRWLDIGGIADAVIGIHDRKSAGQSVSPVAWPESFSLLSNAADQINTGCWNVGHELGVRSIRTGFRGNSNMRLAATMARAGNLQARIVLVILVIGFAR